jgi:hypothetical protein
MPDECFDVVDRLASRSDNRLFGSDDLRAPPLISSYWVAGEIDRRPLESSGARRRDKQIDFGAGRDFNACFHEIATWDPEPPSTRYEMK